MVILIPNNTKNVLRLNLGLPGTVHNLPLELISCADCFAHRATEPGIYGSSLIDSQSLAGKPEQELLVDLDHGLFRKSLLNREKGV